MRRRRTLIVLAVSAVSLLALAAGAAYGQAAELWTARHNGSANAHDSAKTVVTDADGNVFVTGFERAIGTGDDAVTRKYDPDGNLIWENPRAAVLNQIGWDIAVDSSGDVYVADSQFTVLKYSGVSGELLWERVHGGNVLEGNVLELDRAGNVLVVGQRAGASGYSDIVVASFRGSDGEQLWSAAYDGFSHNDVPAGLALGPDDSVYVGGSSSHAGPGFFRIQLVTLKYSSGGNRQWSSVGSATADSAVGIEVDSDGNAFTAATTIVSGQRDYKLVKHSPGGRARWTRRYDSGDVPGFVTSRTDLARDVAVDGHGNVTITGESFGPESPPYDNPRYWDYATVQWDTNGDVRWVQRYHGGGSEFAEAITVDADNNVYVTGGSRLLGRVDEDMATVKYDADGNEFWTHRYDNGVGDDIPKGLTATADRVYVAGLSRGVGTNYDYLTLALSNS